MSPTRIAVASVFLCSAVAATACSDGSSPPAEGTDESNIESTTDLFAPVEALPVRISAPLSTLFQRYKDGQADPPKPVAQGAGAPAADPFRQPNFSEQGKVAITQGGVEKVLDMRVYVRGESSKNDCPFLKLKIEFSDKEQLKQTPFKGHGKFRINTHCGPGDASARSGMGRVMNGVGPVREELTYRLVRAAGIPTYRTRVLAVHYADTAANTQIDSFAMAVESGDDAAQRFAKMTPPLIPAGAVYLDPNTASSGRITPENTAQIAVAEAFSGNKDWGGTHNIDSFGVLPPTNIFQIAQDFDLGAIVLGDIARYWKGVAPISDAQPSLRVGNVASLVASHKGAMEAAYREAEKAAVAERAIASSDGATTTDPGFLEAKKRMDQLFALPELTQHR